MNKNHTDRYFYILENVDGEKHIHVEGNLYPSDNGENTFEIAEWSGCYIPLAEAQEMMKNNTFFSTIDELVKYQDTISTEKADEIRESYFGDKSSTYLDISDITAETACGCYHFDRMYA